MGIVKVVVVGIGLSTICSSANNRRPLASTCKQIVLLSLRLNLLQTNANHNFTLLSIFYIFNKKIVVIFLGGRGYMLRYKSMEYKCGNSNLVTKHYLGSVVVEFMHSYLKHWLEEICIIYCEESPDFPLEKCWLCLRGIMDTAI